MNKIVVTGGRDFKDVSLVWFVLNSLNVEHLYVGDATGVDDAARKWASFFDKPCTACLADWDENGKAAGPMRNKSMLELAGKDAIVVAFPGGKGTENCVKQAKNMNMIILRVEN